MGLAKLWRNFWRGGLARVPEQEAALPGTVIYLAGDVGAALDRLAALRAQGIEVCLGLGPPLPREAFVIVDAPSFDAPYKFRYAFSQVRQARPGLPAMVLTGGDDLLHRELSERLLRRGPPEGPVLAAMARLGGLLQGRWSAYALAGQGRGQGQYRAARP